MTTENVHTLGFGVLQSETAPHQVLVNIPTNRSAPVEIVEDLGIDVLVEGGEKFRHRASVDRDVWRAIVDRLTTRLNSRLAEDGFSASRFRVGKTQVNRLLGRELLVLAWGIEGMIPAEAAEAARRWDGYRPEEMWWLYQQVARAGGRADSPRTGWRLAIRYVLSDPAASTASRPLAA